MLPKKHRFPLRAQPEFFQQSRKIASPLFLISFQKQSDLSLSARAAVIVPKTISRKATDRNQMKRWIRETLRVTLPQLGAVDIVVLVRRKLMHQDLEQLKTLLHKLA